MKPSTAESDNIFRQDAKNAEILNIFFFKPVKNLTIPEFEEANPFAEKISQVILKAIYKHSSIQISLLSIMSPAGERSCVSIDNVFKEIKDNSPYVNNPQ